MFATYAGERATRRYPRTITVPNPAAGADWTTTVPAGRRWTIEAIYATLSTSGVAASRRPRLQVTDGNAVLIAVPSQVAETASLAWLNSWVPLASAFSDGLAVMAPIPPFVLDAGAVIKTATALIDAGDQWSGITISCIEEWIAGGRRDIDADVDVEIAAVNPALYRS